ncbi:MAG TPA: cytochrome c4, partial [Burkholderiaceae bacterium]
MTRIVRSVASFASAWLIAAGPSAAPVAPLAVPDTIAQRVSACGECHGREGRSTDHGFFPRIAGKPAGYLYNQLDNFRSGRRSNATMTYLVEQLSDDYLREIAGYFGGLGLPYAPPQVAGASAEDLATGEALVRRGDAARGIP